MFYTIIAVLIGAFVIGQIVTANVLSCLLDEGHHKVRGHLPTHRPLR